MSIDIFGNIGIAFVLTILAGNAEPIGAAVGFLILLPFLSEVVIVSLMAFVAGIMVYISLDELVPTAHNYGNSHTVKIDSILGMLVMALNLLML